MNTRGTNQGAVNINNLPIRRLLTQANQDQHNNSPSNRMARNNQQPFSKPIRTWFSNPITCWLTSRLLSVMKCYQHAIGLGLTGSDVLMRQISTQPRSIHATHKTTHNSLTLANHNSTFFYKEYCDPITCRSLPIRRGFLSKETCQS